MNKSLIMNRIKQRKETRWNVKYYKVLSKVDHVFLAENQYMANQ